MTAAITNRGADPMNDLPVTLDVDGEQLQTVPASRRPACLGIGGVSAVHAGQRQRPRHGARRHRSAARRQRVPLRADARPSRVPVLVVDDGVRASASVYLAKALSIGTTPVFHVEIVPVTRVTPASLTSRAVVVLNDVPFPGGGFGAALETFVERGGGLLAVLGEHSTWPDADAPLLAGRLGGAIDPASGTSASIGFVDYSHPALELFKAPRSGGFSGAHVFRYRGLVALADRSRARAVRRWRGGGGGAAHRRTGGRSPGARRSTIRGTISPLQPAFLPLVHQLTRYLARYEEPAAWYTVGQAIDLAGRLPRGARRAHRAHAVGPARRDWRGRGTELRRVERAGLLRAADFVGRSRAVRSRWRPTSTRRSPTCRSMDPQELAAAVTGHAAAEAASARAAADARGSRASPGDLVVSARRGRAPARGRDGGVEPPARRRRVGSCRTVVLPDSAARV